jgi:glycerol kinase
VFDDMPIKTLFRWVEHDPYDLLDSVHTCIEHAIRKLELLGYDASDIECVGLTNQRETLITWDSLTGHPLYPAIIWSDARTIETVETLSKKTKKGVDALRDVCGLPLTTYFSGVKLRWLLDNIPVVSQALSQNRLCVGTVDTWLIYVSFFFSFFFLLLKTSLVFSLLHLNYFTRLSHSQTKKYVYI